MRRDSRLSIAVLLVGLMMVVGLSSPDHGGAASSLNGPPEPDGDNCWKMTTIREAVNRVGQILFRYEQNVRWCMEGMQIPEPSTDVSRYGTVQMVFWNFNGHLVEERKTISEPSGSQRLLAKGQGSFSLCIYKDLACIENRQPWIEQLVGAEGSYEERTDGS